MPDFETPSFESNKPAKEKGELKVERTDFYIENPPRQPKQEIATYIESKGIEGIRVPRRYSLEEAIEVSHTSPVIFRTEHPDEYAGASGVGSSVVYGPEANLQSIEDVLGRLAIVNEEEVKEHYRPAREPKLSELTSGTAPVDDPIVDQKYSELSYSAWEVIPGINKTIYRDDVVPNKFHILSGWSKTDDSGEEASVSNYMQVVNGEIVFESGEKADPELTKANLGLIGMYVDITNLERFQTGHSSIMEFQQSSREEDRGQQYFLQIHRGRDGAQVDFELQEMPPGYHCIANVRGSTPPEGIQVEFLINTFNKDPRHPERCSYYRQDYLQTKQDPRKAKVVVTKTSLEMLAGNYAMSHFRTDVLTKPELVLFPDKKLPFSNRLYDFKFHEVSQEFEIRYLEENGRRVRMIDQVFNAHVISDGKKAYISEPQSVVFRFWDKAVDQYIDLKMDMDGNIINSD